MQVTQVLEGQIYKNSKQCIVLLLGKHICYIDLRREAIVFVLPKQIKGDDWELYEVVKVLTEEKEGEPIHTELNEELVEWALQNEPKRRPGRPRKNVE
jgi:hypothetical protein